MPDEPRTRRPPTWAWVIAALAVAYALQIVSPLRLNTDSTRFLTYAASIADGQGLRGHPSSRSFPPAFPLVVAGLDRLGLANAATLVGLQIACLFLGLWVSAEVLRHWLGLSPDAAAMAVALSMLSVFVLKHAVLPQSEFPYFLVSMLALYWLQRLDGASRRWPAALAAVLLVIVAIQTRSIGVTLLPAMLWALLSGVSPRGRWAAMVAAGVAVVGFAVTAGPRYFATGVAGVQRVGGWKAVVVVPQLRLIEAGSLLANLPSRNVWMDGALTTLGVAAIAVLVIAWRRQRSWTVIDVYLACYGLILLVWPYGADARFWLPVLPLLIGKVIAAWGPVMAERPMVRRTAWAIAAWFALVGVAAIAYTTRASLSGRDFAELQGDATYRASYRVAYGSRLPVDPARVDPELVKLLRRFDPRHAQP